MELRPYQQEAITAVLKRQAEGITRQLVALPTGTGKTVVFASLAKQMNCRTLIIAHREELINQAADKCRMVWPGADVGVVMADRDEYDRQVVVASIQTACRPKRIKRLREQDFNLLIIDEAHHSTASTYMDVIEGLGFMADNPDKLLVGVTATAKRGDKIGLRHVFQEITFERSIAAMTKAGYLADLRGIRVSTGLDLNRIATRYGDFVESQLASVVNCANRNEIIRDT
jgi:ATP-dependent helicase IRC3